MFALVIIANSDDGHRSSGLTEPGGGCWTSADGVIIPIDSVKWYFNSRKFDPVNLFFFMFSLPLASMT